MKKFISVVFLLISFCIVASSQKKLGDYIDIDGVPAFIFYLDQSGEHGLAMSIPKVPSMKKMGKKAIRRSLDALVMQGIMTSEQAEIFANEEGISVITSKKNKEMKPLYEELVANMSDYGKNNMEQVCKLCEEKGLSLQEYFPAFWAAKKKGEGWYIPGDKELELFAVFFCGGLGKANGLGATKWIKRAGVLSDNALVVTGLGMQSFYSELYSSTIHNSSSGFRMLAQTKVTLPSAKWWYDLYDRSSGNKEVCFVHEF